MNKISFENKKNYDRHYNVSTCAAISTITIKVPFCSTTLLELEYDTKLFVNSVLITNDYTRL